MWAHLFSCLCLLMVPAAAGQSVCGDLSNYWVAAYTPGRCYSLWSQNSWNNFRTLCSNIGYPGNVMGAEENEFYRASLDDEDIVWLGYQQNVPTNAASGDVSVRRNGWQWMYATSGDVDTGWTNWAAEEPSAGELCASLHQADGKWRGDDCAGENRRLFCEMDLPSLTTEQMTSASTNAELPPCQDGWITGTGTAFHLCFWLATLPVSFSEAATDCEDRNATFLSLSLDEERQLLTSYPDRYYWTSAYRPGDDVISDNADVSERRQGWLWYSGVAGLAVTHSLWGTDEPQAGEKCARARGGSVPQLYGSSCSEDDQLYYICSQSLIERAEDAATTASPEDVTELFTPLDIIDDVTTLTGDNPADVTNGDGADVTDVITGDNTDKTTGDVTVTSQYSTDESITETRGGDDSGTDLNDILLYLIIGVGATCVVVAAADIYLGIKTATNRPQSKRASAVSYPGSAMPSEVTPVVTSAYGAATPYNYDASNFKPSRGFDRPFNDVYM